MALTKCYVADWHHSHLCLPRGKCRVTKECKPAVPGKGCGREHSVSHAETVLLKGSHKGVGNTQLYWDLYSVQIHQRVHSGGIYMAIKSKYSWEAC